GPPHRRSRWGSSLAVASRTAAVGDFPVEAVATMARIANRVEREGLIVRPPQFGLPPRATIPNAIAGAVGQIAEQLDAAAIITLTKTGATARNVSKFRPAKPILAVTPSVDVARRMQMVWGVQPLLVLDLGSADRTVQAAIGMAQEKAWLSEGDLVVMTAGTLQGVAGSTDLIKVEVVTAVLGRGTGIGQAAVSGRARVARTAQESGSFNSGEILIAPSTDAGYVEAMRKAAGIITEDDSLTSHAAILGLRLGVPVIVGVKNATQHIREGAILTLDARRGLVYSGTAHANGNLNRHR
ncbi:MAG: pyruvate kinase alpha/beta domain-containing protein, partial [Cyanobacteria bacterium J06641_5]